MILTFYSDKGGCGRSLLTRELGLFLQRQKKDTLLVDMDYKCTVTKSFGMEHSDKNILNFLQQGLAPDVILSTEWIDLIAGHRSVKDFTGSVNLQQMLSGIESLYPYVLVDTASLEIAKDILASSHCIVIPLWVDEFSKMALADTLDEILNVVPAERIFILYMAVDESESTMELVEEIENLLQEKNVASFNTAIRYDETVREILHKGREFRSFVPVSDAAEDIENLALEIIDKTYKKGGF